MERRLVIALLALGLSLGYSLLEKKINKTKNVFIYPIVIAYFTIGEYAVEKITKSLKIRILYVFIGVLAAAIYAAINFKKKKIH